MKGKRSCKTLNKVSYCSTHWFLPPTVKSSMFYASFWGSSRLGSAFIFSRWFILICMQVTTPQDVRQATNLSANF